MRKLLLILHILALMAFVNEGLISQEDCEDCFIDQNPRYQSHHHHHYHHHHHQHPNPQQSSHLDSSNLNYRNTNDNIDYDNNDQSDHLHLNDDDDQTYDENFFHSFKQSNQRSRPSQNEYSQPYDSNRSQQQSQQPYFSNSHSYLPSSTNHQQHQKSNSHQPSSSSRNSMQIASFQNDHQNDRLSVSDMHQKHQSSRSQTQISKPLTPPQYRPIIMAFHPRVNGRPSKFFAKNSDHLLDDQPDDQLSNQFDDGARNMMQDYSGQNFHQNQPQSETIHQSYNNQQPKIQTQPPQSQSFVRVPQKSVRQRIANHYWPPLFNQTMPTQKTTTQATTITATTRTMTTTTMRPTTWITSTTTTPIPSIVGDYYGQSLTTPKPNQFRPRPVSVRAPSSATIRPTQTTQQTHFDHDHLRSNNIDHEEHQRSKNSRRGLNANKANGNGRPRKRMRTTTTTTTTTEPPYYDDEDYYDYENDDDYDDEYDYQPTTTTTTTRRPRGRGKGRGRGRGRHRNRDHDRNRVPYRRHQVNTEPTTTTTTTTLSPNYKPRPDGRIIDYHADPNFPYELKGADLTDYPFYISIPENNFDCKGRHDGYYANIDLKCQVYHHCAVGHQRYDFLCPNYTLFDQTTFTCRFVNTVDCEASENHYNRNNELYVETTTNRPHYYLPNQQPYGHDQDHREKMKQSDPSSDNNQNDRKDSQNNNNNNDPNDSVSLSLLHRSLNRKSNK